SRAPDFRRGAADKPRSGRPWRGSCRRRPAPSARRRPRNCLARPGYGRGIGMRRIGHIDERGAVELGLSRQRIYRLLVFRNSAVMADIGNPAVALMMDPRLIGAAPLQIAVADGAHIAGLGLVLSERGSAD